MGEPDRLSHERNDSQLPLLGQVVTFCFYRYLGTYTNGAKIRSSRSRD